MEKFKWLAAFETGVSEIDEDHRKLFKLTDGVFDAIVKKELDLVRKLVSEFVDASKKHFSSEEDKLSRINFPNVNSHIAYHASLLAKANALLKSGDTNMNFEEAQRCHHEVVSLLIDDVIRGDSEVKSYCFNYYSSRY